METYCFTPLTSVWEITEFGLDIIAGVMVLLSVHAQGLLQTGSLVFMQGMHMTEMPPKNGGISVLSICMSGKTLGMKGHAVFYGSHVYKQLFWTKSNMLDVWGEPWKPATCMDMPDFGYVDSGWIAFSTPTTNCSFLAAAIADCPLPIVDT